MTDEQIIEMARETNLDLYGLGKDRYKFVHHIKAFAKLVAQHEREACAQIADKCAEQIIEHNFSMLIAHQIRARGEV